MPELPDSFFGWIPVLYKVTEEEVLASAGLDAYVVSNVLHHYLPFDGECTGRPTVPIVYANLTLVSIFLQDGHEALCSYVPHRNRDISAHK